jgi:hypothetical protein
MFPSESIPYSNRAPKHRQPIYQATLSIPKVSLNMPSPHNTLGNDEWLLTGNSLFSENGVYEFRMQKDGKIVVYENGEPKWQNTKEQRSDVKGVRMQADGSLVI